MSETFSSGMVHTDNSAWETLYGQFKMVYADETITPRSIDTFAADSSPDDGSTLLDIESVADESKSCTASSDSSKASPVSQTDDAQSLGSQETNETAAASQNSADETWPRRQGPGNLIRSMWNRARSKKHKKSQRERQGYGNQKVSDFRRRNNIWRGKSRAVESKASSIFGRLAAGRGRSLGRSGPKSQYTLKKRSQSLGPNAVVSATRNKSRGRSRSRKTQQDDGRSNVFASELRATLKPKVQMKEKIDFDLDDDQADPKKRLDLRWAGLKNDRSQGKTARKKPLQCRSKSTGAARRSELPPRPPQKTRKPSNERRKQNRRHSIDSQQERPRIQSSDTKQSTASQTKSRNGKPNRQEPASSDDAGDQSLFDNLIEAWNSRERKESMADYENSRLGDTNVAPERIRTKRRLEIAAENEFAVPPALDEVSHELTVSDDDSISNEKAGVETGEETSPKADLSVVDSADNSIGDPWEEIVRAADIISRHYEVDMLKQSPSARRKENFEFQKAMRIFREHARRLKMGERELFAAVREDPSILNAQSTFDEDDTLDHLGFLMGFGAELDKGLDEYVDAFEGMLFYGRCGPPQDASTVASRRQRNC